MPRAKKVEQTTGENIQSEAVVETVIELPLTKLHYFKDHPFKVNDDEAMIETSESIKAYGVLSPAIVRPRAEGDYEIVAGHRRHRGSLLAEKETMPVIVRNLDDDAAIILMVDSNLQRENILPSERAFAYKMKLEAIKRKVGRPTKENGSQVGDNLKSVEIISENAPDSARQIQRFVRLTELVPDLLNKVDNKEMGLTPAVELSYLTEEQQTILLDVIEAEQSVPSLSQAQRIKQLSKDETLDFDSLSNIMREEKKSDLDKISFTTYKLKKYFPKSYTPQKMQDAILKILENWYKKKQQSHER